MTRAIKMVDLEADIRWQADQDRALLRHTSAQVRRQANKSIQRFREIFSDNGSPLFLKSHSGTTPVGRKVSAENSAITYPWTEMDVSSLGDEMVRIYKLSVHRNGRSAPLYPISLAETDDYDGESQGIPVAFNSYDRTKIGLFPATDSAYNYTLWYLPLLPELLADGDEFDPGVPDGEQWVIWDVIVKLLFRDNYPDLYGAAMSERNRCEIDILHRATKHQRVGPTRRLDTRGRKMEGIRKLYFWGNRS